jgi:hypothetical protein
MASLEDLKKQPVQLLREIQGLQDSLQSKQEALKRIQYSCQHAFGDPKYTPTIIEGHEIPGDPPGTMGVDWRGPMWVSRQETPRWTRTCSKCLLEQETSQTRDEVKKVPLFS